MFLDVCTSDQVDTCAFGHIHPQEIQPDCIYSCVHLKMGICKHVRV